MTNSLRNIKDVIYHEFGHVLVYCLANGNKETFLSKIFQIVLGYKNRIEPFDNLYYFKSVENNEHINENSKDIKKSVCWIILQLSGCIFECFYNKSDFENCFCGMKESSGKKDFDNLFIFSSEASFSLSKNEIKRIKNNYIKILTKNDVFEKVRSYLDSFIFQYGDLDQYHLYEESLEIFLNDFEMKILDKELQEDFNNLINIEIEILALKN